MLNAESKNTITKIYSSMTMSSKPQENNFTESRIAEFKSQTGLIFRAKFIGCVEVNELRGKTVAENAMAKLKFDIFKKRQHKTRIIISLKWNGFFVSLSEGGQELLHFFQLEQISFVWKDSTDERAVGIIISELSADKQSSMSKFYAYKTEKPALPLIMTLKELFMFRTNENSESMETEQPPVETKNEESSKTSQDLLDLNFYSNKSENTELYSIENLSDNFDNKWNNFSNNNFSNHISANISPIITNMTPIPNMMNNQANWRPVSKPPGVNQSPFDMSWPTYSCVEKNMYNPFMQPAKLEIPTQNPNSHQNYQFHSNSVPTLAHIPLPNQQNQNLFSDLIPLNYGLDNSGKVPKNSITSAENEARKISLFDLKNSKLENEPKMDFSVLDNGNSNPMRQKISTKSLTSPLFQID